VEPYDAGCFGSPKLAAIQNCRDAACPASCSGHGICNAGTCDCDVNYFGSDCSVSNNLFEKCIQVNQLSGDICTRLLFGSCSIKLQIVLEVGSLVAPISEYTFPLRSLGVPFLQNTCTTLPGSGCNLCYTWNSLDINPNSASGCGNVALYCGGDLYSSYPLGCFTDNAIVPACFGTCPNDCSGHGNCSRAACVCDQPYSGDDCSYQVSQCATSCGHGDCLNGACVCENMWTGNDCTTAVSDSSVAHFNAAYIVIPFVLLAAGVAIGIGIWYIKKRKETSPRFSRFDLMEDEEAIKLTTVE